MIKYTELTALLETNSVTLIILSTLVWCYNPFQSQCDTAWWASEDKCGAGETDRGHVFPSVGFGKLPPALMVLLGEYCFLPKA